MPAKVDKTAKSFLFRKEDEPWSIMMVGINELF
jgi:hypothetical protein